jgi:hypothetical protein
MPPVRFFLLRTRVFRTCSCGNDRLATPGHVTLAHSLASLRSYDILLLEKGQQHIASHSISETSALRRRAKYPWLWPRRPGNSNVNGSTPGFFGGGSGCALQSENDSCPPPWHTAGLESHGNHRNIPMPRRARTGRLSSSSSRLCVALLFACSLPRLGGVSPRDWHYLFWSIFLDKRLVVIVGYPLNSLFRETESGRVPALFCLVFC